MTHDPQLPDLDTELAGLVAAERAAAPGPDGAQRARLRARLVAGLVLPAAAAAAALPAAAAVVPKVGAALGGLGKPAAVLLAVTLGAGAVVGIRMASRSPSEPAERPASVAPAPAPVPMAPPAWAAVERALLEAARAALVGGQGERALQRVDEHARRFPSGLLAEEREALRVSVLMSLGRREEARTAAARFEAAHPASLHRDAIRRALRSRD